MALYPTGPLKFPIYSFTIEILTGSTIIKNYSHYLRSVRFTPPPLVPLTFQFRLGHLLQGFYLLLVEPLKSYTPQVILALQILKRPEGVGGRLISHFCMIKKLPTLPKKVTPQFSKFANEKARRNIIWGVYTQKDPFCIARLGKSPNHQV